MVGQLRTTGPKTTYTGRSGEYFVASQLLLMGYNAMPMPVDSGIDLIAHGMTENDESILALFQVKTTQRRRCEFRLKVAQLNRFWQDVVNLVVVFWDDPTRPISFVIPPSLIYMILSANPDDDEAPIRIRDGVARIVVQRIGPMQVCIRNRQNDWSPMINRFDVVECLDHDTRHMPPYVTWSDSPKRLIEFD